jgi:hypothetical protein
MIIAILFIFAPPYRNEFPVWEWGFWYATCWVGGDLLTHGKSNNIFLLKKENDPQRLNGRVAYTFDIL